MGVVWQARDERLRRPVAVKELARPGGLPADQQRAACRRAIREAQAAARLSHPNVVRVFDITEEGGYPWIVMELLPPWSLQDLIEQRGPLGPARTAAVGLGVLAALRAAHAEGIVHRDVKPANVVLAPDRVVLTDFGIAQVSGPSALTAADVLMGSPSYIAPERARGGQPGPQEDLWALGALLYAAVEGRAPFDRDGNAAASLSAALTDEPVPVALWPVISGLLRKDPALRLDEAQAEWMLRRVADEPAVLARTRMPTAPSPRLREAPGRGPEVRLAS
jgi:eukaryotic-like serine/threonine-protein kinase